MGLEPFSDALVILTWQLKTQPSQAMSYRSGGRPKGVFRAAVFIAMSRWSLALQPASMASVCGALRFPFGSLRSGARSRFRPELD